MVEFKDFDESKLFDYTSENLRSFINEIEMKKSVILEQYSSEIAEFALDDRFDAFSRRGQRRIDKVAKKYSGSLIGADEFLRIIKNELSKREQLEENMRYSGKGSLKRSQESEEEFLKKEADKTWVYRSKIE